MQIVQTMDVACLIEETLVEMLRDEDDTVRAEAALTLAGCRSPAVRSALEIAVQDRSPAVREAAIKSLKALTT